MAKAPTKKQTTPNTPEQAMDELTEVSQELGLYDITDNPLVKDDSTVPPEAATESLEPFAGEINATVAQTEESDSSIATEPLNATEELEELLDVVTEGNKHPELIPTVEINSPVVENRLTLRDGWGKEIPTKLVVIQSMNYTDLVGQVLFAAYLGAQLDSSFRIMNVVPFRIRVLMPEDQYENFLSKESQPVFDETTQYNKVLVKAFDLYTFFRNVIKIGKEGACIVPRQIATRKPFMVPVYTRSPVADTPESRVDFKKVKYTREELESFSLESLKIVGGWYDIVSSNSKLKYVKAILEVQGK